MRIYDFESCHEFLAAWIRSCPSGGRGELSRLAKRCGIHTTTLSQILKGTRLLSAEQAVSICDYVGLSEQETKFFLLLLQRSRAGTPRLRELLDKEIRQALRSANELANVLPKDGELTKVEQAEFYSNWFYIAAAVLASIPSFSTAEALGTELRLPRRRVMQILKFLVSAGILREDAGKFAPGLRSTHLEAGSPLIARHHGNWRVRAMEKHPALSADELAYSGPMSVSRKDAKRLRAMCVEFIREVNRVREKSSCEEGYFLNLDWIRI